MSNINELRPSTIDGIKRLADRLQTEQGISRAAALDRAAIQAGFQNYAHARVALNAAPVVTPETSRRDAYRSESRAAWIEKIDIAAGPSLASSTSWTDYIDIMNVLRPFMGQNENHGYYPTGGGNDFTAIRPSLEGRCLELAVGELAYIVRPRRLRLERIASEVAESFLYLELDELELSGVHPPSEDDDDGDDTVLSRRRRQREELCDLGGLHYLPREVYDQGFIEHEDDTLPPHARRIQRLLSGNMMFVCKASIWNGISQTYNGVHDQLGADGVRDLIERGLSRREDRS